MDTKELKRWIIIHNVRQRTMDGFWLCFENYRREEPEEYELYFHDFSKNQLTLNMCQVALKIKAWDNFEEEYNANLEYIEAYLDLRYNDVYIGYYSLLFHFSGETFDDYFVLE